MTISKLSNLLFVLITNIKIKGTAYCLGLVLLPFYLIGQQTPTLSLEDVKALTLNNNFNIKIATNNVALAENNTNKGANGYLPTLNASGGLNANIGGSQQTFSSGMENVVNNAVTLGANAAVNANYTIFDKRRGLTLEQLKENVSLSNLQLQQTIEQNLLQVYNGYFQVAQAAENITALEQSTLISQQRLKRARLAADYGQDNGLAVLNAEVDIQRDSINLINAQQQLANAKRNLNVLMGRSAEEAFNINSELSPDNEQLELETLLQTALKENINLQINRKNLAVNEMTLDIIDAERKPTVNATASYTFNYSDNPDEAFITSSNNRGLGANVGVNWNIFDGSRKVREQNTRINLSNQKLQISDLERQTQAQLINAWESYKNALYIRTVQQSALKTNEENFARTQEQLRIGRVSSIEFRQAQINLLNAQTQLNNAKYDVELRKIQVLQLAGLLP